MGGYKQTDPTCYVVDWPHAGVFKIGYSCNQRWRKFVLRGANVVALHAVPRSTGAFALECYFESYALMLYRRAFQTKTDEAAELLGPDCGGYLECHRGDGHEFYDLMLKHCHRSIAQIEGRASDLSSATYGRTYGRTNADASSPTGDNSPSVTRTRTYGDFADEDSTTTCQHREWTRHFEWKCDQPAGHGGRAHFLVMARLIQEAS